MKKQIFVLVFSVLFTNFLLAQEKAGGGGGNCPDCTCSGLFSSCSSGLCCPPNLPTCNCGAFTSNCGCKGPGTTRITLNEGNLVDLQAYLSGRDFSSATSKQLNSEIGKWITSYRNGLVEQVSELGGQLENLARSLPAAEKQKTNAWIRARGGKTFIE